MAEDANLATYMFDLCAILLDFSLGTILARKTAMTGRGYVRKYYFGVTCFFFAHGIFVITHVIYDLLRDWLLYDIGVFLVLSSIVLLVASIEVTIFTRSRYFFTILGCMALGIIMIDIIDQFQFPIMPLMIWVQLFVNPVLVLFIITNYFNAVRRAKGPTKKNAILVVIAIIIFSISQLSQFPFVIQYIPDAELIGAILMDVSIVMLFFGFMHLSIWKQGSQQQFKENSDVIQFK